MATSYVLSSEFARGCNLKKTVASITAESVTNHSGHVDGVAFTEVEGYLSRAVVYCHSAAAYPTDNFTVTLTDGDGITITALGAVATNTAKIVNLDTPLPIVGSVNVSVASNSVPSAEFKVILYTEK